MESNALRTAWSTSTDDDDVIRFVLRRKEWHTLITGLAVNMARNQESWDAMMVVQHAHIDIEASAMVKALAEILKYAQQVRHPEQNDIENIRRTAERGLKEGAPEAKERKTA